MRSPRHRYQAWWYRTHRKALELVRRDHPDDYDRHVYAIRQAEPFEGEER